MKKCIILLGFIFIAFSLTGQTGAKLITRSDDMGFTHSANLACIQTFQKSITTSIEVIVPSPWFPEAVKLLN